MNSNALIEGIHSLSSCLRECDIPHAFGGAIAYGFYGTPRMTNDYDINVFLPESSAPRVFACLAVLGVESDTESLRTVESSGQVRLPWAGTMVDLFFSYAPFHDAAHKRVKEIPFEGQSLIVLSSEDIVVFKIIFNRPHDWDDVEQIVIEQGAAIDLEYVNHWLIEILGADDSRIARLAEVVTAAREVIDPAAP